MYTADCTTTNGAFLEGEKIREGVIRLHYCCNINSVIITSGGKRIQMKDTKVYHV